MIKYVEILISVLLWSSLIIYVEDLMVRKRAKISPFRVNSYAPLIRMNFLKEYRSVVALLLGMLPLALLVLHGRDITEGLLQKRVNISIAIIILIIDLDIYWSAIVKRASLQQVMHVFSSNLIMLLILLSLSSEYGVIDIYTMVQQQGNYTWGLLEHPILGFIFLGVLLKKMSIESAVGGEYKIVRVRQLLKKIIYSYLMVVMFMGGSANIFPILAFQERHAGILPFFEWLSLTLKIVLFSSIYSLVERRYIYTIKQSTKQMMEYGGIVIVMLSLARILIRQL